jgi:hypothetical protein
LHGTRELPLRERWRRECSQNSQEDFKMPLLLLIVLFIVLLGALPAWPYSREWGYYPSGTAGTVLLIVLILVLLGRF